MGDKIIFYPSNWLYNAGVVGFLRVLEFAKKKNSFQFKDDGGVEIDKSVLENFELFYFEYVSKLHLMQRFSIRDLINSIKNQEIKGNEERKKEIRKIIDIAKESENKIQNEILNIGANENWSNYVKNLYDIKNTLHKNILEIDEKLKNIIEEEHDIEKINKVSDDTKKNFDDFCQSIANFKAQADYLGGFYFNKGVVANPKGARKERPADFREKYLNPIINIKSGKNLCILCGNYYSEENISEFTEGDFSILGISSSAFANFYNYYSSNGLSYNRKCSLCQLILLCAFAGFNLKPFQLRELDGTDYIFINYPYFKDAFYVNNKIQEEFKNYQFGTISEKINTYMRSLGVILEVASKKTRWLLENIYFAELKISRRKDQTKPKFVYFNIDKAFAEVFNEISNVNKLFKSISFSYEVYKNNTIYLSNEILKRLLEKKPIIYIIFKMLSEKIRDKDTNMLHIWSMILLEFLINQKRRLNMSAKKSFGILKGIQDAGKRSFSFEEIEQEKRFHISQRFLTLIRGARKEDFFNELLRLFVVYEKPIPENLFSLLTESEEITFQEKALAFLTGFINPRTEEITENNQIKEVGNE